MDICTQCGQKIFCLPDNARCRLMQIIREVTARNGEMSDSQL